MNFVSEGGMRLKLVTAPTVEPLSLFEAKNHLRIDLEEDDDDTYVSSLIVAARQWVEEHCARALVDQTWEVVGDDFPSDLTPIKFAMGSLRSVTSVKYYDVNSIEQTFAASKYQVDDVSEPGRVILVDGESWPDVEDGKVNAVRIRFVAGYGATASAVPEPIKSAMRLLIGHMYENREPEIIGAAISRFEFAIEALLAPYRNTWSF